MKGKGNLVVSLRGVNFGVWSHLQCSGNNAIIFSREGLVKGYTGRNISKNISNDHNASDMLLIPLELIKSNHDSARKVREACLFDRSQTLEPLGINRRDEK